MMRGIRVGGAKMNGWMDGWMEFSRFGGGRGDGDRV